MLLVTHKTIMTDRRAFITLNQMARWMSIKHSYSTANYFIDSANTRPTSAMLLSSNITSRSDKCLGLTLPTRRLSTQQSPPSLPSDGGSAEYLAGKLSLYSELAPTPISIAEFMERGGTGKMSEEESYCHLVKEVLVRLAHLLIELNHLPKELREEGDYSRVVYEYRQSFNDVLQFEHMQPNKSTLRKWSQLLKNIKLRHRDVVPVMASACMKMKTKYGVNLDSEDCALTRTIQYCLDRLYMSRISLKMLINQHLMVYGHQPNIKHQVGVIHPNTDIESVVRHAYDNALFLCEQSYLAGPPLELASQNSTSPNEKVTATQIPSHIHHIVFEIMKNAMQATVDRHLESSETLPPIKVLICQSNSDITIRVSDLGGGIDRSTQDKIFKYLYTTAPRPSLTCETAFLSGLGYGLPLARLYARYFQGELRAASYEGHGTDIYIYLQALAGEAIEHLPVWSPEACSKITARSSPISDWTSRSTTIR